MKVAELSSSTQPGAPSVGWASGPLGVVQAADREIARLTAVRARALAEFAASRPASADRQPGEPGAMSAARRAARPAVLAGVSEWAVGELSIASSISKQAAGQRLERSMTLVHRLPGTLAALTSGLLHDGHLFPMLERVAVLADDEKRTALEREVLAWVAARAARRQITTPAQLADRLRRIGLGRDPKEEADELLAALKERGVAARPDRRAGMAGLHALLSAPEAQAVVEVLGRHADALDDPSDRRTRGQKMADVLLDLVLRPGETDLPPVQAQLTVVAGVRTLLGGSGPGEIGGEPVPAEMVRAVARALGLLPDPAAPEAEPAPAPQPGPVTAYGPDETWSAELWGKWQQAEDEDTRRALAGVWGGRFDEPPPEVQQRMWAAERHWGEEFDRIVGPPPDGPDDGDWIEDGSRQEKPDGRWPEAHAAVDAAGLALLRFQQAVSRASAAVGDAWWADQQDEHAWRTKGPGRFDAAVGDLDALRQASAQQRAELAALLDRSGGGTLVDRPRIALVDELTGVLLALTDARELRRLAHCGRPACRRRPARCGHDLTGRPDLGPPPPTDGYAPDAALDRYVRARDRVCRAPGCRRRVRELDHSVPWPAGPTSAENLEGFCTGDHRGKHQAPGWTYDLAPGGTLTVTTPSGLTATTDPPPF